MRPQHRVRETGGVSSLPPPPADTSLTVAARFVDVLQLPVLESRRFWVFPFLDVVFVDIRCKSLFTLPLFCIVVGFFRNVVPFWFSVGSSPFVSGVAAIEGSESARVDGRIDVLSVVKLFSSRPFV